MEATLTPETVKRDHANIGQVREKRPPFSLVVTIYDQYRNLLAGTIRVKGKWDQDWVVFTGVPSATYISRFQVALPEIAVSVAIAGQVKTFDKCPSNPLDVVFNLPPPPPVPASPKRPPRPQSPQKPPPPDPPRREEVDVHRKVHRLTEQVFHETGGESVNELPPVEDQEEHALAEDHADPQVTSGLLRLQEDQELDVIAKAYAAASGGNAGELVKAAQTLALKLNKFLQQKMRGTPTMEFSTKPRGSLAYNRILPTLATASPRFVYRKFHKKVPLGRVLVLVDLSQSTAMLAEGRGWGRAGVTYQVRHAILLAALTLVFASLERGGRAAVHFFADVDNPNHCSKVEITITNAETATRTLLQKEPGGSTRLDELLHVFIEEKTVSKATRDPVDAMFILMDGAPMGSSQSPDDDDRVQANTVSALKQLEDAFPIYVLWGKSKVNPPNYDEPFFRWVERALRRVTVVNIGSFDNFPRYVHAVWDRPPPSRTAVVLPYNTELRYPFQLGPSALKFAKETFTGPSVEEITNLIVGWVTTNVKYLLPNPLKRDYETADEVYKSRTGCCGEVSNLICGFLRAAGVPAGILDVKSLGRVRLHHAAVGYIDNGQAKVIDVCMGSRRVAEHGQAEPMSDERWAGLMDTWRSEPGAVGEAVEAVKVDGAKSPGSPDNGREDSWAIALL